LDGFVTVHHGFDGPQLIKQSAHFLPEGEVIIAQDKRSAVLGQSST
jgi:hypothetical protein